MDAILAFALYLSTSIVMLAVFVYLYVLITPYDDFALIKKDNIGAAIILTGAILGFTFPLLSSIYYTHSIVEMAKWGAITGGVQLIFLVLLRRVSSTVVEGEIAPAIVMASIAVAVGLINAVCISG